MNTVKRPHIVTFLKYIIVKLQSQLWVKIFDLAVINLYSFMWLAQTMWKAVIIALWKYCNASFVHRENCKTGREFHNSQFFFIWFYWRHFRFTHYIDMNTNNSMRKMLFQWKCTGEEEQSYKLIKKHIIITYENGVLFISLEFLCMIKAALTIWGSQRVWTMYTAGH